MYPKCMQNVYEMYTTFRQTFVYILYTKSKEICQLNFVYELYATVCRNVGYILYAKILFKFCIQNVYKSLWKYGVHFVYKHFV